MLDTGTQRVTLPNHYYPKKKGGNHDSIGIADLPGDAHSYLLLWGRSPPVLFMCFTPPPPDKDRLLSSRACTQYNYMASRYGRSTACQCSHDPPLYLRIWRGICDPCPTPQGTGGVPAMPRASVHTHTHTPICMTCGVMQFYRSSATSYVRTSKRVSPFCSMLVFTRSLGVPT